MNLDQIIQDFETAVVVGNLIRLKSRRAFPMSAEDYLQFASDDLNEAGNSVHSLLNALSNIKRSLDCRADTLIYYWGLQSYVEKNNLKFRRKMGLISQTGIITPDLLNKVNKYRNEAEHDYAIPVLDKVQDYFDVAQLFLHYTDKFMEYEIVTDLSFDYPNNSSLSLWLDRDTSQIALNMSEQTKNGSTGEWETTTDRLIFNHQNVDDFLKIIKWWYAILGRRDGGTLEMIHPVDPHWPYTTSS